MIVELPRSSSSSTISAATAATVPPISVLVGMSSLGSCEKNVYVRSQIFSRSPFCSSCLPSIRWPLT